MQIIKSNQDRRTFKHIKLINNLEVLLVSDKDTQMASASLAVNVGSFLDTVPGIAHFLEHMLFMGSKKYPNENEYDKKIKEYNGSTNAYTSDILTNYFFDCIPEGLFKILDIFAQFFIEPLFANDAIHREINAVNSEYQNSLTNEHWRNNAVLKELCNKNHPISQFSMGNLKTLNIPNIREHVIDFYNKYYSSHLMKLVIVGQESLKELEEQVTHIFSHIPPKNVNVNYENYENIFNDAMTVQIIPLKNEHKLIMTWPFNTQNNNVANSSIKFLSHLISNECKKSLFYELNKKFYAKWLTLDFENVSCVNKILNISIGLTDNGFNNINIIKSVVCDYLELIGKSSYDKIKELYDELAIINKNEFKNYNVENPQTFATGTSAQWIEYNLHPTYLLLHNYHMNTFDLNVYKNIMMIINNLTFKSCIVQEISKSFNDKDFNAEKWYGTKYKIIKHKLHKNIKLNMSLFDTNKYICLKDNIIHNINHNKPQLLEKVNMRLWHKHDTSFDTPCINFMACIKLDVMVDLKTQMIMNIYGKMLDHVNNAEIYSIKSSNYQTNININYNTVKININGYPEKFMNVLDFLITSLLNIKSNISEEIFTMVCEMYKNDLENYKFRLPSTNITNELSNCIIVDHYCVEDKLRELENITFNDILNFDVIKLRDIKDSKKRKVNNISDIYGIIQGNVTENMGLTVGNYIDESFEINSKKLDIGNNKTQIKNNIGNDFVTLIENPKETNCCTRIAIKFGDAILNEKYIEKYVYLDVLDQLISSEYFNQLRTLEQLGYTVYSYVNNYGLNSKTNYMTYDFCVQSSCKPADYLNERTKRFIHEFKNILEKQNEIIINNIIESKILNLNKNFQNLDDEFSYNSLMITKYNGYFDFNKHCIESLKKISKSNLIEFYNKYFSLNNDTYWTINMSNKENSTN